MDASPQIDTSLLGKTVEQKPAKKPFNRRAFFSACALILASSVVRSISITYFISPNKFAPGGVTGISTMLSYLLNKHLVLTAFQARFFSIGLFIMIFNIPLLIIAAFLLNKSFVIKTAISTTLVSVLTGVLDGVSFGSYLPYIPDDKIFAGIASGVLSGAGLALILKCGGSTGGTDIAALIIQKKIRGGQVPWIIFTIDTFIISSSVFVFNDGFNPVMIALCEMFVSSKVATAILHGLRSAFKFEVITTDPEALSRKILEKLGRGVTNIRCEGMYTHTEKYLLICLVRRNQISAFRRILDDSDSSYFAYITPTTEVLGLGFRGL